MENLLFLAHRIPYPPNKGDKIRSWNMLSYLAERYRVHLGCFVDDPDDQVHAARLSEICGEVRLVSLRPTVAKLASLRCLATGGVLTLGYYRSPALSRWCVEVVQRHRIKRVLVYSSAMAQYALPLAADGARLVVDFVDVDSRKWTQYAEMKPWPASWIYGREGRALARFERAVARAADASLFVSEAEADVFRADAPESAAKVFAVNNGVDFDFFDPARDYANPFPAGTIPLVFTGQMDYWANVDAVKWFAHDVLPAIRGRVAAAEFWIVGANPTAEVAKLAHQPGVRVTGRVADVRPYVAHAAVVVAPLRVARGVQNKVLEAMSMAKAVVATPEAVDGISAAPGRDIFVAADSTEFATLTARLIGSDDCPAIGHQARERVVSAYSWSSNLAGLNTILEGSPV